MKRKNITAAIVAFAIAASCFTTGTSAVSAADAEYILGDTSGEGFIDSKDASEILAEYSRLSTGKGTFTGSRAKAADVNGDGRINASDASDVLKYYSYVSTGGDKDLPTYLADQRQGETGMGTAVSALTTTVTASATTTAAPTTAVTVPTTTASVSATTITTAVTTVSKTTATASATTASSAVTTSEAPVTTSPADPNKVSEIRLSNTESSVEVGEGTLSAKVTMFPVTAKDQREIWSSSDESIAVVDDQGWVIGKKEGVCTITVKSAADPEISASVKLNVTNLKKVTEIRLSRSELTMEVGTSELSARVTMLPASATDLEEIWSCSDEHVIRVDNEGWITAIHPGNATVTVRSANNPEVSASIAITVTGKTVPETTDTVPPTTTTASSTTVTAASTSTTAQTTVPSTTTAAATTADPTRVAAIELSLTTVELVPGERGISYVKMLPETAKNKDEIWTSNDPKIATVDKYGNITAVSEGSCTITVRSADNTAVSADVTVNVYPKDRVRKIELTDTELTIELGSKKISYVKILPATAVNLDEMWVCSDTNIASVDEYGWITGRSIGECTVTVYSVDNPDVKADIKVTVVSPETPPVPSDIPPMSMIDYDSTNDERVAFCTPFPDTAKGRFSIEYVITYCDGTVLSKRTSVLTIPTLKSYTAYFRIYGDSFSVSSYLYNEDSGERARIGSYEFVTSPADFSATIEDIVYAFYYVGGLTNR
ncbi:MAG: Ig-like domain-containing protein [Ruminococcus sp.]|nr:Ig-like domain-containing protein [Ruminococcus sp.]